ncbi:mannan endo-1,6-alpha-mannosidase [Aspergillus japonicus CBS 114.51]|uniref:Mannan endo-1,6-alpha-mannosidase n=1 Tax=Aspergillus japonicus CBS 114.51 TaxID=1448312 RepID=A0A8T8XBJ9_ASPJA|nr:mannan endo-1,6-alpha-mannosidase [Aspergillus japonicus CBS 114.51]RAH84822.1 mannan endo-1,6-alpha-mannosidase [Aspergillus japonicus CBS 114.51]
MKNLWSAPAWLGCLLIVFAIVHVTHAIDIEVSSEQSIKDAASTAAYGLMSYYHGNESGHIPGKLDDTWWEGGAMFMALILYYHYTSDSTYNKEVIQGMQWQAGDCDYMPSNYSSWLGNDDQMFWGLAAMTAAELNFPNSDDGYSWLALAQGVFNTQVARWDTTSCNGGMRWQMWSYESGYTMKNTISNAGLFQLSARLARYTSNQTYYEWAEKIWDWSASTPLLSNSTWNVADSTETTNDCSTQGDNQWTYNYGAFLGGAAYMYNYTNGTSRSKWQTAVNGLLNVTFDTFFPTKYGGNVMSEITCEPTEVCNRDEIIFKGLLSNWLAFTAMLVPSTYSRILPKLQGSAEGAAASCTGYSNSSCGVRWNSTWDGWSGLEEQMSVVNVFVASLLPYISSSETPRTASTGGNSTGDPSAGTSDDTNDEETLSTITTGDRVGAAFVTVILVAMSVGSLVWMIML